MTTQVEEFFRRVLPDKGFPVVVTLRKNSPPQTFSCESIADFFRVIALQKEKCEAQKRELYFGLSTLNKRSLVDEAGKYHTRIASNCRYIRTLALDIDVDASGYLKGDTNKPCFISQQDAVHGIEFLCEKVGLNQPYIVSSGYGLHVYWPFEQHVDTNDWWSLATRFKAVCMAVDLRFLADPTRATDRAGILRVPASFNYKNQDEPAEVRIVQDCANIPWSYAFYSEALDFFIKGQNIVLDILPRQPIATGPKLKKSTLVDLSVEYPATEKANFKEIYQKCPWVKNYMENPANRSEPEWKAMVDLSLHTKFTKKDGTVCEDLEMTVFISKAYPGYTLADTVAKRNKALEVQAAADGDSDPTARTCFSFESAKPGPCRTCQFRGHVKTPLRLEHISAPAKEIIVETPVVISGQVVAVEERKFPDPPFPYMIGEDGGVYMRMKDPETGAAAATKKIYEYTILPVSRILDENSGNELIEIEVKLPHNAVRRFSVLGGELQDPKGLAKTLGNKGIFAQKAEMDAIVRYLIAYATVIQRAEPTKNNYNTFGWKERNTVDTKFVLYDAVIRQGGVIDPYRNTVHSLRDLGPFASARGSLELWKKGFAVYEGIENTEPYVINLMLAFGAPLLAFLDEFGMIYNMYGKGGEGKSSSIEIATSVWGKPSVKHALAHDTTGAILDTLGTLSSMPMAFDELTKMEPDALSEFAYTLSNGRGRNRLQQTGERRLNNYHWQTFVLTNSNHSLYGKLSGLTAGNDAHGYRILELESPPPNPLINVKMSEAKQLLSENYGMAGREFMRYVMENYALVAKKTREARDNYNNADRSKERYWVAAQACIQTAGYITKDMGLHNYEAGRLLEYMEQKAPRAAVQSIAGDAVSKLNDYMMQNLGSTIKVMDDQITNIDIDIKTLNNIAIRLEGEAGQIHKAFIPAGAIERWCKHNDVDLTWMRSELQRSHILLRICKKRIGAGTKHFSVQSQCWELDMQHPHVTGIERKNLERPNVVQLLGEKK